MASADAYDLGWLRPDADPMALVGDLAARMRELSGRGAVENEAVVITVDHAGTVSEIVLNPMVMRLHSAELSAHLLAAARAASDDLQAKMQLLMREVLGTIADVPPGELGRQALNHAHGVAAELSESLGRIEADVARARGAGY
jgi:hypothetical protein